MSIKKIKKGWSELDSEIIKAGKCVYCGACAAFCMSITLDAAKEVPIEDGSCKDVNTCRDGYGVCYNICPKTEIDQISTSLLDKWVFNEENDQILGHYIDIVSVKLSDLASEKLPADAGPLTGLLYSAMEDELIDCSITTSKDANFRPYPILAKSPQELFQGVGYKPSQSPTISLVGEAINKEFVDIAVVGTPCQIQSLRKLQNHPQFDFEAYDLVSLAVGTFCLGTFYNQLIEQCFKEQDINPSEITKIETDRNEFKMIVSTSSGKKKIPLNHVYNKSVRNACFSCSDYTASFADVSVGNIGSQTPWKTMIIRTIRGKEVFEAAVSKGMIEVKNLEKDKEEIVLDITRNKTEIVKLESILEHSPEIKSITMRSERIAKAYRPGQFVMLWLPDVDFLPMSISNVNGNLIEVTVQKIGEGTEKLFELKEGDTIGMRGPFGNCWNHDDASNILIVAGGMGIAAMTSVIESLKQNKKNVTLTIGAKDETALIFADRLIDLIPDTMCSTDDGSRGKKCFVTDTIDEILAENEIDLILTCGPEVMMKTVQEIAENKNIEIQASLERKMKCGVGLCGSCCVGKNNDTSICKDGPIFNSNQLKKFPQFGTYSK